ncbi:MAG: ATP-binding cassette domain-containing protein [Firmicutes bacterium]|nr:ATP-binding cassette domain-containing protein [Bacillota bacterium]
MISLEHVDLRLNLGVESPEILKDISLEFEPGKLYVITGPNGGGKTSVAKVLMGIFKPTGGIVRLEGEDITGLSITERARRGIRYAFQNPPRFKGMDVGWFLRLAGPAAGDAQLRNIMRRIGLCPEEYLERMADTGLSGGEMKRLEIASVLLGETKVAILDEPEAGVDLWGFEQLLSLIIHSHVQARTRTTILISHSEKFLEAADEIIIIANGQVQERGKMKDIRPLLEEGIYCRWRKVCLEGEELDAVSCNR